MVLRNIAKWFVGALVLLAGGALVVGTVAALLAVVGALGGLVGAGVVFVINEIAGTNVPLVYGAIAGALLALLGGGGSSE